MQQVIANRYRIIEAVGEGGMGRVYKGLDTRTQQLVAIKHLKADLTSPELIERFKREGDALRQLNHPNIVKMLDTVEENKQHYLIIEYLAGGDLNALLKKEPLSVKQIVKLALEIADALTRAHHLNIIHRDLKPANILLADDGTPRLSDFGIAHIANKQRVTANDRLLGTVDYLAPEAIEWGLVDNRTDIWAFGVLLFEMLTGIRPFTGTIVAQTLLAIVKQPTPDIERLRPDIPVALADLIYRMLEKDPQQRIPSVRSVGAELEDILYERTQQTVSDSRFDTPKPDIFSRPKHNLPAQSTPFVGREAELDEITRLLDDAKVRLVTILAPGGMGKTRLALAVAERYVALDTLAHNATTPHDTFPDGVYFVELASLSEPETIIPAIAEATSFQFQADERSQKQQILDFLRAKKLLLVQDNYEHLLDGASLVTDVLNAAPHVQILVTSRQRLNQPGETLLHLSGMDFPEWETPADAMEYAAVKLFINSAQRAQPGFELTSHNLREVARICRLVQGMPLAIVLAAAWVALLLPQEIANELLQNMNILADEAGELPKRQQSIKTVFEYSWQTMTEAEQVIFMKMSVFQGGFSREAAQAVTGATLQQLMSLVNKSLLRRNKDSGRYEIHELLRQYGAEKLILSGAEPATRAAHAAYYAAVMQERQPYLSSSREIEELDNIEREFENVRTAWLLAVAQRDENTQYALMGSITHFCEMRNRAAELIDLLELALAQEEILSAQHRGRLLAHLSHQYAGFLHRYSEAESMVRTALAIARDANDSAQTGYCLWVLSTITNWIGQPEQALIYAQESLQLNQMLNNVVAQATLLRHIAILYGARLDQPDISRRIKHEAYALYKQLGQPSGMSRTQGILGVDELWYGDVELAEQYFRANLNLRQRLRHVRGIAAAYRLLGMVSTYYGRLEEAYEYALQGNRIAVDSGNQYAIFESFGNQGFIVLIQGRYEFALQIAADMGQLLSAAGSLASQYASIRGLALCGLEEYGKALPIIDSALRHAAYVANSGDIVHLFLGKSITLAYQQQYERALELLAMTLTMPESRQWRDKHPLVLRLTQQLKAHFDDATYKALHERGAKLNWRETVKQLVTELEADS